MKKIKNPDTNRIYHVWHYCKKCGKALMHSTAVLHEHVKLCKHSPQDLLTFSTQVNEVWISEEGGVKVREDET